MEKNESIVSTFLPRLKNIIESLITTLSETSRMLEDLLTEIVHAESKLPRREKPEYIY